MERVEGLRRDKACGATVRGQDNSPHAIIRHYSLVIRACFEGTQIQVVITLNSLSSLQVCLEDDYLIGGSEELCRNHYIKMEG